MLKYLYNFFVIKKKKPQISHSFNTDRHGFTDDHDDPRHTHNRVNRKSNIFAKIKILFVRENTCLAIGYKYRLLTRF